jgi:hypothetical protein
VTPKGWQALKAHLGLERPNIGVKPDLGLARARE